MSVKTMKSDVARNQWRNVLDQVAAGDDVVIERYNKPVAAVIRYEEFLALQEELDELRAAQRAQTVLEAWRHDRSIARPWEEVRAELDGDELPDAKR
jgi:prevent-host-death family protein